MMLRGEPFAPPRNTAAITKNELKKTRNRDDASGRFEFAIMERVKEHFFLPKTAGNCQPF